MSAKAPEPEAEDKDGLGQIEETKPKARVKIEHTQAPDDAIPAEALLITDTKAIKFWKRKMKKKCAFLDRSDDIYEINILDNQGKVKRCRYTEDPDESLPPELQDASAEDTVTENLSQLVSR